jgi:uncharacterized coiled-coil protein SlyX
MASETDLVPAAQAASDAAAEIQQTAENAEITVDAAIEAAEEAREEAEETAEAIAAAAIESERGRRIETLEGEFSSWRERVETLQNTVATQTEQLNQALGHLSEIRDRLANPPTVTVTAPAAEPSLTPPPSEASAAVTVTPAAVPVVVAAPEAPRRKHRLI